MAKVNVDILMNDKLRNKFEATVEEMGMDMEEAFNIFAQKVVNEKEIPFEILDEDYPQKEPLSIRVTDLLKAATGLTLSAVLAYSVYVLSKKRRSK